MSSPAIHTTQHGRRWFNTREGARRAIGSYDSRAEAATAGRLLARADRTEHVTHHPDGSLDEITFAG
jgi:hypothetical protein